MLSARATGGSVKLGKVIPDSMELSIVIPCLNEAETLAVVISNSYKSISNLKISGEIIVADNGSTDNSRNIAKQLGARVIDVPIKGYGAALKGGIEAAKGRWVIMGDADDSYELEKLDGFVEKLNQGFDLVMGNRFLGGIDKEAMPWLHKYLGNPVLSWIGRKFFKITVGDFHCGLRAFNRKSIQDLNLKSDGMEFASEMVVKSALNNLRITEIPTRLRKDGRSRRPHLRTWRDGWRHLVFLLAASPRWLFLYPALFLTVFGTLGVILTAPGEARFIGIGLDSNAFFISLACLLAGTQTLLLSILARVFSGNYGFLPESRNFSLFERYFTLERGIVFGLFLLIACALSLFYLITDWNGTGFDSLSISSSLRITGLVVFCLSLGIQLIFASFFAILMQV